MATCGGARAACMCGWWPRVAMAKCSSRMPVRVDVSCGVSPSTNRNACIRSLFLQLGSPCRAAPLASLLTLLPPETSKQLKREGVMDDLFRRTWPVLGAWLVDHHEKGVQKWHERRLLQSYWRLWVKIAEPFLPPLVSSSGSDSPPRGQRPVRFSFGLPYGSQEESSEED